MIVSISVCVYEEKYLGQQFYCTCKRLVDTLVNSAEGEVSIDSCS